MSHFKQIIRKTLHVLLKPFLPALRVCRDHLYRYPQTKKVNARNPQAEKPRVLVSGRNYCSNLCIARALGKAGYEVEVLRIFRVRPKRLNLMGYLRPDAYSKYVKAFNICVFYRQNKILLNKLIELADRDRKMLLIPADDVMADLVDTYYEELSQYYVLPNARNTAGAIVELMDKATQKRLAEAAGLRTIPSCIIRTENHQFTIPETVKYPCFVKPNVSTNGLKAKMQSCSSEEELRILLTTLSEKHDIEMQVQDFIDIGTEFSILGLSTKEGVLGPGFFGAEEGGHADRRGVALTGRVVSGGKHQADIDQILKFVSTLEFEGLFDVDLIEAKDGTLYFVELNMRFGGSGYAITESGVNLPGIYADYALLGKPIDFSLQVENPGKRFVSEKILLEEYTKGYISWDAFQQHMASVDIHFIKDEEDPAPYDHFRKFYPAAKLMRQYYLTKAK